MPTRSPAHRERRGTAAPLQPARTPLGSAGEVDAHDSDRIRLTVPATATAVRIIRVGASALATRAGFTYREADELRLAVGEAAALLARGARDRGAIVVTYDVHADRIEAYLRLTDPAGAVRDVPDVAAAVLDASVDDWEVVDGGRCVALHKVRTDLEVDVE